MTTSPYCQDDRWDTVRRLFDAALALEPAARDAYLCRVDDDAVLVAVRRLIAAHDAFTGTGDAPYAGPVARALDALLHGADRDAGAAIGEFRLERVLGEGGMGRVYLAQRQVADVVQRVALKIVPFAVHDRRTIERLRHERAILATLDHPNIARLIDAGELPDDRPYFAMEYVDGVAITRYCDEHALDLRARLALFADVCEAVAYAHRRLVLHRDLKPSNILVDAEGRVRLVDFGIAKSLEGVAANAEATVDGGFFSVSSAAPEQVLGRATSVATDVYGLGCVLHELLAGTLPFRFANFAREAIIDTIVHRPAGLASESARANDAAARARQLPNGPALDTALRGDLDAIVAKTLRKEPTDRYRSVDDLVADVRNVLAFRPIALRASEWRYRFTCFVRRHRVTALVAALLGAAVLATTALSIAQYRVATVERDRAVQALATAQLQRDHARRVTNFLVDSFEAADPAKARGRDLRADELLASAVASLAQNSAKQDPALRATIAQTLAHLFFALDRLPESEQQAQIARAAFAQVAEPSTELRARQNLADAEAAFVQNRYHDAVAASGEGIDRLGDGAQAGDGDLLYALWSIRGRAYSGAGESSDAAKTFKTATDIFSKRADTPVARIDLLRQRHAAIVSESAAFAEARDLLRALLDEQRTRPGADAIAQIETLRQLAKAHSRLGDFDPAQRYLAQALSIHVATYGDDNAMAARLMADTAALYAHLGRYAEALQLRAKALDIGRRRIGANSPFVGLQYERMGAEYHHYWRAFDQAERAYRTALDETPAQARGNRAMYLQQLGELLVVRERRLEAESTLLEAESTLSELFGDSPRVRGIAASLAYLSYRKYAFDDARERLTPEVIATVRAFDRSDPYSHDMIAQMDEMAAFFGF